MDYMYISEKAPLTSSADGCLTLREALQLLFVRSVLVAPAVAPLLHLPDEKLRAPFRALMHLALSDPTAKWQPSEVAALMTSYGSGSQEHRLKALHFRMTPSQMLCINLMSLAHNCDVSTYIRARLTGEPRLQGE